MLIINGEVHSTAKLKVLKFVLLQNCNGQCACTLVHLVLDASKKVSLHQMDTNEFFQQTFPMP